MNKQWQRKFAAGWDELHDAQRYDRARYVVDEGIDKGATTKEAVESLKRSGSPMSDTQIRRLLDFYYVSEGIPGKHTHLKATARGLTHAMERYETDPGEVAERAEEITAERGYSPTVATRAAKAEIIGQQMAKDGLISNGELQVGDPRDQSAASRRQLPKSWDWNKTFEGYWGQVNDFLSFLRRTKQDAMTDAVIPQRLLKLAEGLERQHDRFDIGVSKHAAKSKAGATR